ncbi:hypothetical protein [Actinomadura montaniterrae]|uniref:PH domain-containing protein n=1 Tax=Actinomadura montaniterrae TaxID=1803903 RepID=A0A6L3VIS4_9ACTN|nr:hypothetical protein [Actinomadura montaniterrae]KAB2363419.1 hypothetical protein F9B16_43065 [Actinomadura montaniterrae]
MDELVLHQRSRRGAAAGTAGLAVLGAVFVGAGAVMAAQGGTKVIAAVVAFGFGGLLLALAGLGLRGGVAPDRLALTPGGVSIARRDESFLLPAAAIGSFGLVPVKSVRTLNVRFDPASAPDLPPHVARLRTEPASGELRLVAVGERKPFASPELAERARAYVTRHALGEWRDG